MKVCLTWHEFFRFFRWLPFKKEKHANQPRSQNTDGAFLSGAADYEYKTFLNYSFPNSFLLCNSWNPSGPFMYPSLKTLWERQPLRVIFPVYAPPSCFRSKKSESRNWLQCDSILFLEYFLTEPLYIWHPEVRFEHTCSRKNIQIHTNQVRHWL